MKFFCVADEDTVRGFRLAVRPIGLRRQQERHDQAIRRAADRPDLGIVILTDTVAADVRGLVDDIRMNRSQPLIVEIPGPQGPMPGCKTLRQLVQEAVGIRIGQEESSA